MDKRTIRHAARTLFAAAALAGLAACTTTVSRGVDDHGQAKEIIFPGLDQASGLPGGIFPNVENMRKIGPGVSKDDLLYLIGHPHFRESFGAREWDYVMKFRETPQGPVSVCQYKVIFDKDMKGQSFHWKPADCARFVSAPVAPKVISLKGDSLFRFNGSSMSDMLPGGRAELDRLAEQLKGMGSNAHMRVVGHTDRLGSDAYNQNLSQRRAQTVRDYLVGRGVPAANISAMGVGKSQPAVQCSNRNRQALIDCLQPNRRVDVAISGAQP